MHLPPMGSNNRTGPPSVDKATNPPTGEAANPEDTIVAPFAASCASCHDGAVAKSHMDIMGAKIGVSRAGWSSGEVESCAICHGPGADFDTVKMHK